MRLPRRRVLPPPRQPHKLIENHRSGILKINISKKSPKIVNNNEELPPLKTKMRNPLLSCDEISFFTSSEISSIHLRILFHLSIRMRLYNYVHSSMCNSMRTSFLTTV